jgi:uncharacterized protein YndB with AHSA1/START domain
LPRYRFLTTWLLDAPREQTWEAIQDVMRWPDWWRGVVAVDELDAGGENRIGSRYAIQWRSRIPYPIRFEFTVDEVERPSAMMGRARGELEGVGRWQLFEDAGTTAVLYDWDVSTTKPWMNLVAPVARPIFAHNHDVVMGWGGEGLARLLGARLLARG